MATEKKKRPVNSYHGDRLLWGIFKLKPDLDFRRFKREDNHQNEVQQPETTRAMPNTRVSSRYRNKPNKSQEHTLSTKPVALHAAFARMISRDQKGDPYREPLSLSLHPAGILSPDQRVAAVLQHRLYPTMGCSCWWCRCCCCCCRCCYCCCCYCCYYHASASCCCSSGKPSSRRRFC